MDNSGTVVEFNFNVQQCSGDSREGTGVARTGNLDSPLLEQDSFLLGYVARANLADRDPIQGDQSNSTSTPLR